MTNPLSSLGVTLPVLGAPMAGGPTTPALVTSLGAAGALGFLAGGYRTAAELADQIATVRTANVPFGVNLFAPNPVPVDLGEFRRYADALRGDAGSYGLELADAEPREDNDHWDSKIDLLVNDPVPVVSFTFGLPDPRVVAALRAAGTVVVQTVTSVPEAEAAAQLGLDALVVQGAAAGAHSATLNPARFPEDIPLATLVGQVAAAAALPLVAAGGLATSKAIAEVLRAGATAVMVGTVLLRTDESGASPLHQAALADPDRTRTILTRAFSGRPARALRNTFTDRYHELAPSGYPAVHYLTSPLRKAATQAGNPELVNLWAGTGYREAVAEPARTTLARLTTEL